MKPQLKKALSEGGVNQAMKVCSVKAPQIAKNLSEQTQWQIKRVSLKARNKKTAQPERLKALVLNKDNHVVKVLKP
mgnify:CR=1 FL=1